tara:strand:+ start:807 stop:1181 length:375 start_codon:yes stop_codon:yes gene_type:complete
MGTNPNENESEARSLLGRVSKEIKSIPDYKGSVTGLASETPFEIIGNSVTAARRAIRFLKGKPSKGALVKKQKSLLRIVKDAETLRKTAHGVKEGGKASSFTPTTTRTKQEHKNKMQRAREDGS